MTKFYPIPDEPVYDPEVRELLDSDPASATDTFNPTLGKMVENTAAVARMADESLEAAETKGSIPISVTLAATGWTLSGSKYIKTIDIEDIHASGYSQFVGADPTDAVKEEEYNGCNVKALPPTVDGKLTFRADSAPSMSLLVNIIQFKNAGVI